MANPTVPDWIRTYTPPHGWTNVFALVPSNRHLYGTETLFGDWDGETLLLAKDGAPSGVIRALRDKGDPRPWRHAQRELGDSGGYKTNEALACAAAMIPGRKLYGSATANLLCDDPRWSRTLPGFYTSPLATYFAQVLAWVLGSMPNVQRVACLGQEAWFLTATVLGRPEQGNEFKRYRDSHAPLLGGCSGKRLTAFALFHPAARVTDDAKRACWAAMLSTTSSNTFHQIDARGAEPRQRPEAAAPEVARAEPVAPPAWRDMLPSPNAKRASPDGVRKGMLALLTQAGEHGVLAHRFATLGWQTDGFRKDKLFKAMQLLANETGRTLQYQYSREGEPHPARWRLKH
jgi:hypothetical protein